MSGLMVRTSPAAQSSLRLCMLNVTSQGSRLTVLLPGCAGFASMIRSETGLCKTCSAHVLKRCSSPYQWMVWAARKSKALDCVRSIRHSPTAAGRIFDSCRSFLSQASLPGSGRNLPFLSSI